jgi:hypothetical protein
MVILLKFFLNAFLPSEEGTKTYILHFMVVLMALFAGFQHIKVNVFPRIGRDLDPVYGTRTK